MKSGVKILKKIFSAQYSLLWVMAITLIYFSVEVGSYFYSFGNIMTILAQSSSMIIITLGVSWIVATGEMDASFHDIAACSSMVFAVLMNNNYPIAFCIILTIASGLFVGLLSSLFIVKFRTHSLITTIATATIARSFAASIYGGIPLPIPKLRSTGIYSFLNGDIGGVPIVFLVAVALLLVMLFVQEKTKFGQYVYACGENRQAVKENGISERKTIFMVYIIAAAFAAFAGIVMVVTAYGSGQPRMGSSLFLDGYTTLFLGAMLFKLGKPNVAGTFIGAIQLSILVNGLTMTGASFASGQIIKGLLLVLGVAIVSISKKRQTGSYSLLKFER